MPAHLPDEPWQKSGTGALLFIISTDEKGNDMAKRLSSDRAAALLIFVPALLSLVIVLHHPVLRHTDAASSAALTAGINRIAAANAAFHAIILLLLSTQALGLYSFAERLGLSSLWVRAGVLHYGLSTILLFVPGTIDGFVTPLLGSRCMGDAAACAGSLAGSLAFEWAAIQAFTKVALALQALALLCWSITLALRPGAQRWAGVGGALIAIAPLAILGTMTQSINPARLAEIILFEAIWSMAAAALLWKASV